MTDKPRETLDVLKPDERISYELGIREPAHTYWYKVSTALGRLCALLSVKEADAAAMRKNVEKIECLCGVEWDREGSDPGACFRCRALKPEAGQPLLKELEEARLQVRQEHVSASASEGLAVTYKARAEKAEAALAEAKAEGAVKFLEGEYLEGRGVPKVGGWKTCIEHLLRKARALRQDSADTIHGRRITEKEALEGLGDRSTWAAEQAKLDEEMRQPFKKPILGEGQDEAAT